MKTADLLAALFPVSTELQLWVAGHCPALLSALPWGSSSDHIALEIIELNRRRGNADMRPTLVAIAVARAEQAAGKAAAALELAAKAQRGGA